jgi:hypothetical protein
VDGHSIIADRDRPRSVHEYQAGLTLGQRVRAGIIDHKGIHPWRDTSHAQVGTTGARDGNDAFLDRPARLYRKGRARESREYSLLLVSVLRTREDSSDSRKRPGLVRCEDRRRGSRERSRSGGVLSMRG